MTQRQKQFEAIAREHLFIETLETRNRDSLDFHDVAVWQVAAALEAAYQAGRADTSANANAPDLANVLRQTFTPHGVALIAAKQQPNYAKGPDGDEAERASAWFAEQIVEMLGTDQYNALCNELGL